MFWKSKRKRVDDIVGQILSAPREVAFARAFPDVAHVWVHRTIKYLRYAPPYEVRDVGGTVLFRIVPDAIYLGCPDRLHSDSWRVHIIPTDGRPSQQAFIVGEFKEP